MSDNTVTRSLFDALNRRVADLEHELAALKRQVEAGPVKDWRRTVGMFTGDDVMKAIFEEGQKIREADREKARKRVIRRKSAKSQRTKA
jgi:hypothetical protein